MKRIGLNINSSKFIEESIIRNIKDKINHYFKDSEVNVYMDSNGLKENKQGKLDLVVVLGGDGTILRTAKAIAEQQTPIFGINMGNLGFLTSIEISELDEALKKISNGDYNLEERIMLQCELREGEVLEELYCLNDIVVSKGTVSGILNYEVFINDKFYTSFNSDSIIVSTPTGSTAYSFSAGGSIIYPTLDVISLIPNCPHSMQSRSIIINGDSKIDIIINRKNRKAILSVDGVDRDLKECNKVTIKKSKYKCKLLRVKGYDYFKVLREKIF